MLSQSAKIELRQELDKLTDERLRLAWINERINAIEIILQDAPKPPISIAKSEDTRPNGNGGEPTFRSAVRRVLIDSNRPLTTSEIVGRLEEQGVHARGKTKLKTLVASELWRAEKRHEGIRRVEHGRYEASSERRQSA